VCYVYVSLSMTMQTFENSFIFVQLFVFAYFVIKPTGLVSHLKKKPAPRFCHNETFDFLREYFIYSIQPNSNSQDIALGTFHSAMQSLGIFRLYPCQLY